MREFQSDDLPERILGAVPGLVFVIDAEHLTLVYANDAAAEATGYATDELRGMPIEQLAVVSVDQMRPALAVLRGGKERDLVVETVLLGRGNKREPVEIRLSYLASDPPVFVALAVDLGERLDAERRLALSEARYRLLFAGAPAPAILIDPETSCLVEANAAAAEYYGYSQAHFAGMPLGELSAMSTEAIGEKLHAAEGAPLLFVGRDRLATGEERSVEIWAGPIEVESRRLVYATMHDVTEREELARERQRVFALTEAIAELGRRLPALDDEAAIYQLACDLAVFPGGLRVAYVALVEPARRLRVYALAHAPEAPWTADDPLPDDSVAARVLAGGRPIVLDVATSGSPKFRSRDRAAGLTAIAGVPLRSASFIVGALTVCSIEADFFGAAEMRLLEQLAADVDARIALVERTRTRRESGLEMARTAEELRALFELSPIGISIVAPDGEVRRNPAFRAIFGYRPGDPLPADPYSFLAPASADAVRAALAERETHGHAGWEFSTVGRARDGSHLPLRVSIVRIPLADGEASVTFVSEDERGSTRPAARPRRRP